MSEVNVNDIASVLNARGKKYGTFMGQAQITQNLKTVIYDALTERNKVLPPDQQETLDMICSKIARIINGDSDYDDNWVDIAGYAQLIVNRLRGVVRT